MARAQLSILSITLLLLFMGLAAILTGIFGQVWFYNKSTQMTIGLSESCYFHYYRGIEVCNKRKVFTFDVKANHLNLDLVLFGLLCSALFAVIASVLTTCMYCCDKTERSWKCYALLTSIFTSFSDALAISAVAYNEYWGEPMYSGKYVRGWSALIAWAGAGELFLASMFTYLLLCISPDHGNAVTGQPVFEMT